MFNAAGAGAVVTSCRSLEQRASIALPDACISDFTLLLCSRNNHSTRFDGDSATQLPMNKGDGAVTIKILQDRYRSISHSAIEPVCYSPCGQCFMRQRQCHREAALDPSAVCTAYLFGIACVVCADRCPSLSPSLFLFHQRSPFEQTIADTSLSHLWPAPSCPSDLDVIRDHRPQGWKAWVGCRMRGPFNLRPGSKRGELANFALMDLQHLSQSMADSAPRHPRCLEYELWSFPDRKNTKP